MSRDIHTYTQFGSTFEPWEYTDWIDESMSWKDTLYIGDWSPLAKMRVTGREALKFFSASRSNSFAHFEVGQAKHIILCNRAGKIMGEGVLMRLAEDDFLFTSGPGVAWADYQFRKGGFDAEATQIGDRQFILQLQGRTALFVLEQATGESLRDIAFMRFRDTQIGAMRFRALRQGMAGEVGYELHGPIEHARDVFEALLRHGRDFGIRRLGGRTKMVNHVEACFPTPRSTTCRRSSAPTSRNSRRSYFSANARANYRKTDGSFAYADISELYRTPVELGWRRNVKLDHDFIGRAGARGRRSPRRSA